MKKISLFIIVVLLLSACEKDLPVFSGKQCVDFVMDPVLDSIIYSFALNPGVEIAEIKVPVEIMGHTSPDERTYAYEIDPRSTARVDIDYKELSGMGKIAPGQTTDTIRIQFIKNEDMASGAYTLFLNLMVSEDFEIGMKEKALAKVYVSDLLTQPKWWDNWYTNNVMGAYSNKKYSYFIEVTGISDLGEMELYKMRNTVLKFKYHIEEIRIKAALETDPVKKAKLLKEITDENGLIMNIPLKGTLPDHEKKI